LCGCFENIAQKSIYEFGKVTSIPCSQEIEDVTAVPSTTDVRLRMEGLSILYSETIPLRLQSSIQFEMITKKFIQLLYILLETANTCTILQKTTFVEEHDITVILED